MNIKTDNNEEHNSLLAQVYRAYRKHRVTSGTSNTQVHHSELDNLAATDDELPEKLYRHYQNNRSQDHTDVDDIMQLIIEDQKHLPPTHADQPQQDQPDRSTSLNEPVIDSGPYQKGQFEWLKRLSNRGANDADGNTKKWLSVAAAALIGIALFPLLNTDKSSELVASSADLPITLVENADQLVKHIEPGEARAIGFSSQDEGSKHAFQYGVLTTDLAIFEHSDEKTAAAELARHYAETTTDPEPEIDRAISRYSEEGAGDLDELISSISDKFTESGNQQWFALGQSIETTFLSSQYALTTSDTRPLETALKRLQELQPIAQDSPVSRLLSQLLSRNIQSGVSNTELREIAGLSEQIKSLMR